MINYLNLTKHTHTQVKEARRWLISALSPMTYNLAAIVAAGKEVNG